MAAGIARLTDAVSEPRSASGRRGLFAAEILSTRRLQPIMTNRYDSMEAAGGGAGGRIRPLRNGLGLGHGSTAVWAVRKLADELRAGRLTNILGVPCSKAIEAEAKSLSIPLTTLDDNPVIDLTIDGADEVAPNLDVIKGGGGALLREKVVAQATRREIIVVDNSKLSGALGTSFAVPVEVVEFGLLDPYTATWNRSAPRSQCAIPMPGSVFSPTRETSSWIAPSGRSTIRSRWG